VDNIERLITKLYDKHDDFTLPIVNFIFQHHMHMEFTFHNSYVILELVSCTMIFWTKLSC